MIIFKKQKSQSAIEFVLLFSFMLFIFVGFFILLQDKIVTVSEKNDQEYLAEINDIVLSEVNVASTSMADYHHQFNLPSHIMGSPYTINILDGKEILLTYTDKEQINFLTQKVTGTLLFGENTIRNIDGYINLKNGIIYYNESYKGIFINVNPEICYLNDYYNTCNQLNDISSEYVSYCQNYFGLC
jgi:hypothetical protein